jgi:hypothetical protein
MAVKFSDDQCSDLTRRGEVVQGITDQNQGTEGAETEANKVMYVSRPTVIQSYSCDRPWRPIGL